MLLQTSLNGSDVFGLIEQGVVSTWTSLTTKYIRDDLTQLLEGTTDEARELITNVIKKRLYENESELEDEGLDD